MGEFLVSPQEKVTLGGGLRDILGAVEEEGQDVPKGMWLWSSLRLWVGFPIVGWTDLQVFPDEIILRCTLHVPLR